VNATDSGKAAILQLSGGDMRRVLNLLQSTHMAYAAVNEENVYLTAGAAIPRVIDSIFDSLMNDSYNDAFNMIFQVINEFGYASTDILTEISKKIQEYELPDPVLGYLLDKLSNCELRLSHGASERLQLGSFVGAFIIARNMMVAK
jgi:replication factor C subunit 3/5